MSNHFPALIVLSPLLAALFTPLVAFIHKRLAQITIIIGLLFSNISAVFCLLYALKVETWHYHFGGWLPPWGIEYVIDPLSGVMAVLISFVSFWVAIYSGVFFKDETRLKTVTFYALFGILVVGLLGMVVTGDVFNLYVFLEISSLAGYGLIATGGHRAAVAAFRYLLIGTIGATFYLLGIGFLYALTGSLNMQDLASLIPQIIDNPVLVLALALFVVGFGIKMAMFPLHGWQPDAYTYSHPAATAVIAGLMAKVPAYAVLRFFFFVLDASSAPVAKALQVMGILAAIGIIVGSLMAIAQKDIRRMLAYSSVAQIGYIIVGLAIGNVYGLIGAVFHLINHAFMKSCLFLVAGGVKWRTGEHEISKYAELNKKMPITMFFFMIAALSMIGLPPTAGFFSKWYLILGAAEKGLWIYVVVIIVSSLLNAVYFFRILENAHIKTAGMRLWKLPEKSVFELPITMLVPIAVLGFIILGVGIFNETLVTQVLEFAVSGVGIR